MQDTKIQSDTPLVAIIGVRTAGFGMLRDYVSLPATSLHSEQPSVLFQVDLARGVVKGPEVDEPVHFAFSCAGDGCACALLTLRLGKLFIAAAFNPLDPQTRLMMEQVHESGKFTCMVEFNIKAGAPLPEQMDYALLGIEADVFEEALWATQNLPAVAHDAWLEVAPGHLLQSLPGLGVTADTLRNCQVRCFGVVPADGVGSTEPYSSDASAAHTRLH